MKRGTWLAWYDAHESKLHTQHAVIASGLLGSLCRGLAAKYFDPAPCIVCTQIRCKVLPAESFGKKSKACLCYVASMAEAAMYRAIHAYLVWISQDDLSNLHQTSLLAFNTENQFCHMLSKHEGL